MDRFRKVFFGNTDKAAEGLVILASASPRRRELLERLGNGLNLLVAPSNFAEDLSHESFTSPQDYVSATAHAKGQEVLNRILSNDSNVRVPPSGM